MGEGMVVVGAATRAESQPRRMWCRLQEVQAVPPLCIHSHWQH